MRHLIITVVLMTLAAATLPATVSAQCDFGLTRFDTSHLEPLGHVAAVTVLDDGSGPALIAGGSELLPVPGMPSYVFYNICKWTAKDGWSPLGTELNFIRDLQVFSNELYAAAGQGPFRVAKWTGSEWINAGNGLTDPVYDFEVFDDGSGSGPGLYALSNNALYRYTDGQWIHQLSFAGSAFRMAVYGGDLIVGGSFTEVGDVAVNSIARWNGTTWSPLGEGIKDGSVFDIASFSFGGNHALMACGSFSTAGGKTAHQTAIWNGSDWINPPVIAEPNQVHVSRLVAWDDGDGETMFASVYSLEPLSGDTRSTLYRLNHGPDSMSWTRLGTTVHIPHSAITSMVEFHDGSEERSSLFIGGKFERIGGWEGPYSPNLARLTPQPRSGFAPLPSDPRSIAGVFTDLLEAAIGGSTAVYASGSFHTTQRPYQPSGVARFDGHQWTSLANDPAQAIVVFNDGSGSGPALFGAFNNQVRKWHGVPGSANWTNFGPPIGSRILAMATHDEGLGDGPTIFAATRENMTFGSSVRVVKWNPGTGSWVPLGGAVGAIFNVTGWPGINCMLSFDDGSGPSLWVGGSFTAAGSVPAMNIARWRGPAAGWSQPGHGFDHEVRALHVHNDDFGPALIAGGGFAHSGNRVVHRVARWDGAQWSPIGDIKSAGFINPSVYALATVDDGAGPGLIVTNGLYIARWNGSNWSHLPPVSVHRMLGAGDTLYLAGDSTFSIWSDDGTELAITGQSQSGSFEPGTIVELDVDIQHGGAVTYQWRRNGQPLQLIANYIGVFTDRLLIFFINGSYEGVYDVVVSNDCTSVVSQPIVVDVIGTCLGDIQVDGLINVNDLLAVISAWGTCATVGGCEADLNHDEAINTTDLLMVLNAWGECQ